MKVILLAARGGGFSDFRIRFPLVGSKPKVLYRFHGQIQLERAIDRLFEAGFVQEDIEIVAGFKYQKIQNFLEQRNIDIKVKVNHNWKKSSSYTLLKAIEGIEEDFMLFICGRYDNI